MGIYVWGRDMAQVLSDSALAMYRLTLEEPWFSGKGREQQLTLHGLDLEDLAVLWLNELLFFLDFHKEVFRVTSMEVDKEAPALRAEGRFYPAPRVLTHLKAATFGGISLECGEQTVLKLYFDA